MALQIPGHIALAFLGLYTFLCIFFVYYCVVSNPNDSEIAYFVQVTLPSSSWNRLHRMCGEKATRSVRHLSDRMLVFAYFAIVGGCWSVVFSKCYPWLLYESPGVSDMHAYVGILVFLACFGAWAVANASRPGFITGRSFRRYDHYPYDNLMFQANSKCQTTKLFKIPRSKFDRMKYDGLVPRYDHFCGWTHNTYGEENYRWFLLFLLNHVTMCFYGTYVCLSLFAEEIRSKRLRELTFFDRTTGETLKASNYIIFQYLFARRQHEVFVTLVMLVMGIALTIFLGYHVYITSMGQTTNENGKWADVRKWHKKQQNLYKTAVREGRVPTNPTKNDDGDNDGEDSEGQNEQEISDPGPFPKNLYDRGFVANWSEVFFPLSLRKDALSRGGYSASIIQQSRQKTTAEATETNGATGVTPSYRSNKPKDI